MVHRSRQIRIRERDASERPCPQNISRCFSAILSKEKSGLRIQVRVSSPIQNDACDMAPGVETRS
jgi:hypothetical protein